MWRSLLVVFLGWLICGCAKKEKLPIGVSELQVRRVAVSKAKSPDDILPYDDAFAWDEYDVMRVLNGSLDRGVKKIRVAHWTVRHGKAVPLSQKIGETLKLVVRNFERVPELKNVVASDDLEITAEDTPRFYDLAWETAEREKPENERFDYGGVLADQMKLYWTLRPQLRLVIMGNSHATMGVCPRNFYTPENLGTPMAMNLAPPGSYNAQQCMMIRDYVLPLPKLECVVWVVSARNFNAEHSTDLRKLNDFTKSPGYKHDQTHKQELWPVKAADKPVYIEDLRKLDVGSTDIWGWQARKPKIPEDLNEARPQLLHDLAFPHYTFDEAAWSEFISTVKELNNKGVRVLLLTTPLHPLTNETPALDVSGSTHEGQRALMLKCEALHAEMPNTWFHDFYNDGKNDFTHEDFYDAGHLNRYGSLKLTERVVAWMQECK